MWYDMRSNLQHWALWPHSDETARFSPVFRRIDPVLSHIIHSSRSMMTSSVVKNDNNRSSMQQLQRRSQTFQRLAIELCEKPAFCYDRIRYDIEYDPSSRLAGSTISNNGLLYTCSAADDAVSIATVRLRQLHCVPIKVPINMYKFLQKYRILFNYHLTA